MATGGLSLTSGWLLKSVLLLGQVVALNQYTTEYYPRTDSPTTGATVSIGDTENFSSCTCDLTAGACDEYCCCDSDCSSHSELENWSLNLQCTDEVQDNKIPTQDECFNRAITAQVSDLQYGLRVYSNNIKALFCIAQ